MTTPFFMIINFLILKYLFLLFGGISDLYLILIALVSGIFHLCPMLFEEKKSRVWSRFLTEINSIWTWFLFFFVFAMIIIYSAKYLLNISFYLVCIILAIVPFLGIYNYYHAHKLVIKERTIELDNLKEEINIVHFSDVHFGSIRHKKIIKDIGNALKKLSSSCDLAIISGDLADGSSAVDVNDFLDLKDIGMPIIFTPGNHDFYPGIESVYAACRKANIIILDNEKIEIKGLNIFGLTFSFGDIETVSINKLKSTINEDEVNIMVYHVPDNWDLFSKLGFDIQLSGHTHGGQFYPAVWFSKLIFGFNKGLFRSNFGGVKSKYMHVTTGVGSMDYPMRWGTDSELVVLKLRKK